MTVKMATMAKMTMISNKPTFNEDIQLPCLENEGDNDDKDGRGDDDNDDDNIWSSRRKCHE